MSILFVLSACLTPSDNAVFGQPVPVYENYLPADVNGDIIFNGVTTVSAGRAVVFRGVNPMILGTGTIIMDGSQIYSHAQGNLTFGPDLEVRCQGFFGSSGGCMVATTLSTGDIVTRGVITVDNTGTRIQFVRNEGLIQISGGGSLDLAGIDNRGTIVVGANSRAKIGRVTGVRTRDPINRGVVSVASGATLIIQGTGNAVGGVITADGGKIEIESDYWENLGVIELHDAELVFSGRMTTADLGAIHRSGHVTTSFWGRLDNRNAALSLNGPSDHWTLNGVITGGIINVLNGAQLSSNYGMLQSVALNGSASISISSSIQPASLRIKDGLDLNGAIRVAAEPGGRDAVLVFTGESPQALAGDAEIVFGSANNNFLTIAREYLIRLNRPSIPLPVGDVTIGPNSLIHGKCGNIGINADGQFTNRGVIRADVAGGNFSIDNLTNQGIVQSDFETTIHVGADFTQAGGSLNANGSIVSTSPLVIGGGLLSGSGNVDTTTLLNESIIAPGRDSGDQIGALTIIGDVAFRPNAHLSIQLAPHNSDQLVVLGDLDLSSGGDSLDLWTMGQVMVGTSFTIALYDGILGGVFDDVTPGYRVSYATPHQIVVTAVPELTPWGFALEALAVFAAARRANRRR